LRDLLDTHMKIVFLAPFGLRPKGTVIARMLPLAAHLQALGHEVVIVAPPYTNPEDSGKVETVRGVRVKNIHLTAPSGAVAAPFLAWRLFRAALAEKPDVVHLFKPKGYGGLAALLHKFMRLPGLRLAPLFVDTDDWEGAGGMNELHPYSAAERMVFSLQEKWLLPGAAGVTVASRTLQTKAWGMGIAPERVLYLPNCVDNGPAGNGAAVRERLGIPEEAPVVLLYTRFFEFSQEKLHFLFTEIHRRVPSVRFLVIGRGRNREEELLVMTAEEKGFSSALVMAGWVEPADIHHYLAAGDVAVYPFADTLVNRAKCPAKLTELLCAGIAVVADSVGQLAEYIQAGTSGVLCDPDDWCDMANSTVTLLLDPVKRWIVGKSGKSRVLERFNWMNAATQLEKFYLHYQYKRFRRD
jgi:glycosyltransferase involved in cell wall biosynthesis